MSLPRLPSGGITLFLALWILAALAFALGWKSRVAGAALVMVTGYTLILDHQTYSNHLYLLFLTILLLTIAEQMGVTDLTDFADPAYVKGSLSEVLL